MRIIYAVLFLLVLHLSGQGYDYPWLQNNFNDSTEIIADIKAPSGFYRIKSSKNSFADWLRHLPLKKKGAKVLLHSGQLKGNQSAHFRIVNIDVGETDLQQCADAVMRLKAEYLYSLKKFDKIHFNFTSGHRAEFTKWAQGFRPQVRGNKVSWVKTASPDSDYQNFRKYLETVFMYAGSYSLSKEMNPVHEVNNINIGDVFIQGGFPGHAVIIVDMSIHNGRKAFLLAQSYMPAQEIHILKNPQNSEISPWNILKETDILYTPEWTLEWNDLKRFR